MVQENAILIRCATICLLQYFWTCCTWCVVQNTRNICLITISVTKHKDISFFDKLFYFFLYPSVTWCFGGQQHSDLAVWVWTLHYTFHLSNNVPVHNLAVHIVLFHLPQDWKVEQDLADCTAFCGLLLNVYNIFELKIPWHAGSGTVYCCTL